MIINKTLQLKAKDGSNVTIHALNSSKPVITVNSLGNGTVIQGFIITGASNSSMGISLNGTSNCDITGNYLTGNKYGIYLLSSNDNTIQHNTATNNWIGFDDVTNSNNNTFQNNTAVNNTYGFFLINSNNIAITENTIMGNTYGINPKNSQANIHFNKITGNSKFGLVIQGSSTINATNNWWGKNTPTYIYSVEWESKYYDIYNYNCTGPVSYSPWLVLKINVTPDAIQTNEDSTIIADLTQNNYGNDTSSMGNVPDGIPVNFTTTLGTIITPSSTVSGNATTTLTDTISGVNVSAALDSQKVSTSINVLGVYNERTQKGFSSIQSTIDDADTQNNDTITVKEGIYTQNIFVTKKLNIKAVSSNVIIKPVTLSSNIFTIDSRGNGSTIQGFTIIGVTSGKAFNLNGAANCTITGNTILSNQYGIFLIRSNNITISGNTIKDNWYGINPQYSTATINFNRITGNSKFGLVNQFGSNINAKNNWWGKNTPTYISSTKWVSNYYDIYNYNCTGTVSYKPWFSSDIGFTLDQIKTAAVTVKTYIETNYKLPSNVTISGIQVNMPQFLKLSTQAVLNIDNDLNATIILGDFQNVLNPAENITKGNIDYSEYINIAKNISAMDFGGTAPNYIQTSLGNMRFESLVYLYSQTLNSYNSTKGILPDCIIVNPWSVISNPDTVFLTDQIDNASGALKSYIESNHALPGSITISGKQVTTPQFLQLATTMLLNIEGNLNTSIVLGSVGNATNSTEDIVSGDISYDEYMDIAQYVKSYIDSNGTAPDYAYQTSLGTHMGFASLVYMYAQILNSYNTNNKTLPGYITILLG